jgi:ABC-type transport system substrate-binding protein
MRLVRGGFGQLAIISLVVLSACASPQSAPDRAAGGSTDARPQASQGPKVLVWAVQNEPGNVTALSGLGGTRGPTSQFRILAHSRLATDDYTLTPQPDLALELPSVEKGTWKVNPNGTMETTWKLRPNIKWHDGTPFTSADIAFWFQVIKDEKIPGGASLIGIDQVTSVTTPDPSTVTIHWSAPFFQANEIPDVGPLPKHLLESAYTTSDAETFLNHRYFTTDFVGLGPYKLSGWTPGSQVEFERFNDYFGQRPAIDKVVLRIIPDFNTMVSNIMAGSVDLAQPPAENMDVALDLKAKWEGTGDRVRTDPNDKMRVVYMQFRPETSRPVASGALPRHRPRGHGPGDHRRPLPGGG